MHNGTRFVEIYISSEHGKIYIDNDGSGVFPKKQVRKKYNSKYRLTYSNCYCVMKNDSIKDTRICRIYSGRKRKATGYVLITGHHIVMLKDIHISDGVFMMLLLMFPK